MTAGQSVVSIARQPAFQGSDDPSWLPDEVLLDQFLNQSGEAAETAFRALVVRHGPMVLGVCRHVLIQHQDAEDAFQATFVVLARKAASIRDRRVLGRWLYEVAYRVAIRSRSQAARRRSLERQATGTAVTAPEHELNWSDLRPVIDEEVNRLPEKYRTPVILCYLEGRTNEEVAQLLRCPVGTVKGRLARARELLRSRLMRRGLVLSASFLLMALSRERALAEVVPSHLLDGSVRETLKHANRSGTEAAGAPGRAQTPRIVWIVLFLALGAMAIAAAVHSPTAISWSLSTWDRLPSFGGWAAPAGAACHSESETPGP